MDQPKTDARATKKHVSHPLFPRRDRIDLTDFTPEQKRARHKEIAAASETKRRVLESDPRSHQRARVDLTTLTTEQIVA
jgi:hypothetical protein